MPGLRPPNDACASMARARLWASLVRRPEPGHAQHPPRFSCAALPYRLVSLPRKRCVHARKTEPLDAVAVRHGVALVIDPSTQVVLELVAELRLLVDAVPVDLRGVLGRTMNTLLTLVEERDKMAAAVDELATENKAVEVALRTLVDHLGPMDDEP
jgi:hypothetical protein